MTAVDEARAREVLRRHVTSPGNPRVCEAIDAMMEFAASQSGNVDRLREKVAEIIDPDNPEDGSHTSFMQFSIALEKADAILALIRGEG